MSNAASLDDLVRAAMAAPAEERAAALRLLQGNLPRPEPFLTLRQLGRALGFGVSTLRRWQVPGHDLGGYRRYRRNEVEAYLASESFLRRQAALRAERQLSAQAAIRLLTPQTPKRKEIHALLQRSNHHLQPSSLSSRV